jgi:hypothetical protein
MTLCLPDRSFQLPSSQIGIKYFESNLYNLPMSAFVDIRDNLHGGDIRQDCPSLQSTLGIYTGVDVAERWTPGEVRVLCLECSDTYAAIIEDDKIRLLGEIYPDGFITTSLQSSSIKQILSVSSEVAP